ncbi:hypothetical protein N0V83_010333 [Neocucurbitaria cava]|uniref:Purine permease n=1 Tax=Neocucurbitaria cava TaxID=798079 RepID=A0A9W8XZQ1_9PLEO|nr:hypothetical protein N0V83_010333 [Neocucurbitaria cava]
MQAMETSKSPKEDNKLVEDTPTTSTYEAAAPGTISKVSFHDKATQLAAYLTSRDAWLGNYDYWYLVTPNIYPFNKKYKEKAIPFYGLHDEVPILLTIILGLQHALIMIGSIVSPPLAIASGAFYLDSAQVSYLVSAAFITTGIATAIQVTRLHIKGTPFFVGTGLLSVVGPTFDIIPIAFSYTSMRYKNGTCPVAPDGTQLPCPDAWGAFLGTMLCTVLIQIAMSLVPPRFLNKLFPKIVTGTLLLLVGVYLIGNGMQNWAGSSNCNGGDGFYALCPNIAAPNPLPWAHPKLIGLGFSVFFTIVVVEQFGAPIMKSAAVLFGLAVGCAISGATGYWSRENIDSAPVVTFLWVHTFKLSVDGALVLPLLIMFICQGVSCMPDILATAEISGVDIEGTQFNSRIQGGILCDGLGSLFSALGTAGPMVSQAGNNGVIILTGCAVSWTLSPPFVAWFCSALSCQLLT